MFLGTRVKTIVNSALKRFGLRLETLTAERRESARLLALHEGGYFDRPIYPVPPSFQTSFVQLLFADLSLYADRFRDLAQASRNPVGYSFDNDYFSSPDAEVLYCMVRRHKPRRILEVGSGNSTKIFRLALMDGGIDSRLVSIDPRPRVAIDGLVDDCIHESVENLEDFAEFSALSENDILFIDSSHELRPGNDGTFLYLRVFPMLKPGVLVHIHDIFLPFDYRSDWVREHLRPYTEQYIVQALLQTNESIEVIWPGYYLQRTHAQFSHQFPHRNGRDAQSLWLRICAK